MDKMDTQRRKPCEDSRRDLSDVSASQATPRIAGNDQKLGEGHRTVHPFEPLEGNNTSVSDFWTPELSKKYICPFKLPNL